MKHEKTYLFKNTISKKAQEPAKAVFNSSIEIEVEPAAEFGGSGHALNPEEMFVAAINSCLMQTFFYFTQRFNVEILSYHSNAQGQIEKQSDGFRFTHIQVQAKVSLADGASMEKTHEAGRLAEKYCLVSRSVAFPVDYHLEIELKGSKFLGE